MEDFITIRLSIVRLLMNEELQGIWEAASDLMEVVSSHLTEGTEEKHLNPQSEISV